MAKQVINIGTVANDGTGDPLRTAFDKANDNFTELYSAGSLSLVSDIITFTKADGTTSTIDISAYLDEDARAIASGTLNAGTGIVTFTRDDASTFTLDLSALLDDTNLVTSVNSQTGVVVLDTDDIAEGTTNLYNATHTGEVTGSGALTIASNVVDEDNLKATNTPNDGDVLSYDSATGGFDWVSGGSFTPSVDATTIDYNGSNQLEVKDGGVSFAKIAPTTIVTEAEGIHSNDNDTTIPTSAAVVDYLYNYGSGDTLGSLSPNQNYFVKGNGLNWVSVTPLVAKEGLDLGTSDDVTFNSLFASTIGLDSTDYITWTDNTQMDFYVNGLNQMRLEADGDLHVEGDVIAASTTVSSDERLKEDISTYKNAIQTIKELKGVQFTWKKDGKKSGGVIAQDVEKVLPELVKTKKGLKKGEEETLTVDYNGLIGVLIQAVKELSHKVEKLEKR